MKFSACEAQKTAREEAIPVMGFVASGLGRRKKKINLLSTTILPPLSLDYYFFLNKRHSQCALTIPGIQL